MQAIAYAIAQAIAKAVDFAVAQEVQYSGCEDLNDRSRGKVVPRAAAAYGRQLKIYANVTKMNQMSGLEIKPGIK